jgi:hypothetical protein
METFVFKLQGCWQLALDSTHISCTALVAYSCAELTCMIDGVSCPPVSCSLAAYQFQRRWTSAYLNYSAV